MGNEVFIDPTRDSGVDVSDMSVENYRVLYGSRLTERLKGERLRLFCARSDYNSSNKVLDRLVGICNVILGGGKTAGILTQGILKRLIMSKDIGIRAKIKKSKVVDVRLCYGKVAKNYTGNTVVVKMISDILRVIALLGIPSDEYTLYIELGFLYVSSVDLGSNTRSRDFAVVGSTFVDEEKGTGVRLAYINPTVGLYDVGSKYRNVLGETSRSKIRNVRDWKVFSEKYAEDLEKISMYLQKWTSEVIKKNKVYGNVFLLRQRGSAVEVLDSVPKVLDDLDNDFYEYECKSFKWSSVYGSRDETFNMVYDLLSETFSSSFPDLHSIRWDISIVGSNGCYCYYSKSPESGAVDILITGYDYLNS